MMYRPSIPTIPTINWTRRQLLAGLGSLPLAACVPAPNPVNGGPVAPLIDAHCHLFNITDLPAASFSQIVFLKDHEHPEGWNPAEVALRKSLDAIQAILSVGVMSAAHEAQLGPGSELADAAPRTLRASDEQSLETEQRNAEAALAELNKVRAVAKVCDNGPGPSPSIRSIVTWLRDLRARRATLTRRLTAAHATSGFNSKLLCPALVDYSNWLLQSLDSPLPDQMRAGGAMAADLSLPPVHGYMAFDPLRRALVRHSLPVVDQGWEPLGLLREALVNYGFAGVKLYPPMGFRASGNETSHDRYPPHVERAFGSPAEVGRALDESLEELWQLCGELDAPIMAHAHNSNEAGNGYGLRADPTYWFDVARKHPSLRIMLAHFGSFRTPTAGTPRQGCSADVPFEDTWEAAIGKFVRANPGAHLFADISYLAEVFHPTERERARQRFIQYLAYDPGAKHLIFGSDWIMLGIEQGYLNPGGYARQVVSFLQDVGLTGAAIDDIMYGNALTFLGLRPQSRMYDRLAAFYAAHQLPLSRLPS